MRKRHEATRMDPAYDSIGTKVDANLRQMPEINVSYIHCPLGGRLPRDAHSLSGALNSEPCEEGRRPNVLPRPRSRKGSSRLGVLSGIAGMAATFAGWSIYGAIDAHKDEMLLNRYRSDIAEIAGGSIYTERAAAEIRRRIPALNGIENGQIQYFIEHNLNE